MTQSAESQHKDALEAAEVVPLAVVLIRRLAGSREPLPRLSTAARLALTAYDWPGGYAELETCIERALVLGDGPVIEADHLTLNDDDGARRSRTMILRSLRAARGLRPVAAARLGISPRTLRYRLAALRAEGVVLPTARPFAEEAGHE